MNEELRCATCGEYPLSNEGEENACMLCGATLCEACYDASPYCRACQEEAQVTRSGECEVCGRDSMVLNAAWVCEGCVIQAMMEP